MSGLWYLQEVRVREDVEPTNEVDNVRKYAGKRGIIVEVEGDGTYMVYLGKPEGDKWFYESELEAVE